MYLHTLWRFSQRIIVVTSRERQNFTQIRRNAFWVFVFRVFGLTNIPSTATNSQRRGKNEDGTERKNEIQRWTIFSDFVPNKMLGWRAREGYQSHEYRALTVFFHKSTHGFATILMEFVRKVSFVVDGTQFLHKLYFRCFSLTSRTFRLL